MIRKIAFTMAEILISLTIIGIIAAITLPSLVGNIKEKSWETQRKALHSRMTQAISLMPTLNGYGIGTTDEETNEKAGMEFVTNGLSKVLKMSNICDANSLKKCGIPAKYKAFKSSGKLDFPPNMRGLNNYISNSTNPQYNINTKVAAFETASGESVAVYYNPYCANSDVVYSRGLDSGGYDIIIPWPYFCVNFVFDMNGLKGPNQIGKDIWYMSTLYSDRMETIMLEPKRISPKAENRINYNEAKAYCASINARIPTVEEGLVAIYNQRLTSFRFGFYRNTRNNMSYVVAAANGVMFIYDNSITEVRCIYRDKK